MSKIQLVILIKHSFWWQSCQNCVFLFSYKNEEFRTVINIRYQMMFIVIHFSIIVTSRLTYLTIFDLVLEFWPILTLICVLSEFNFRNIFKSLPYFRFLFILNPPISWFLICMFLRKKNILHILFSLNSRFPHKIYFTSRNTYWSKSP